MMAISTLVGGQILPTALASTEWLHATERSAFLVDTIFSPAEGTHIASLAHSLQPAYVGGLGSQSHLDRSIRDAHATILFQTWWKDPVLKNVSLRIRLAAAELIQQSAHPDLRLGDWHLEFPQMVRYGEGGHYVWHADGGNVGGEPPRCGLFDWVECRVVTAILYLNSLPEGAGGATALRFADGSVARVQPREGSALFFLSTMKHTGEEVRGTGQHKVIVNQWIRFRPLPAPVYFGGGFLGVLESVTGGSVMEMFATIEGSMRSRHSVLAVAVALLGSAGLLMIATVVAITRCAHRAALAARLLRSSVRRKIVPKTV